MNEPTFEEFTNVIDKLEPKARRDVLDIAVYLVWKQTGTPAPWRSVIRGAWLNFVSKIKK